MPSSTFLALASIAGWSYVPDLVTRLILSFLLLPYTKRPPTPTQYRIIFSFVVLSYLTYNFIEAHASTPPNFYELLGVKPDVDGNGLKMAFRAFARKFHPDRVGEEGQVMFMRVREGYEALMSPEKRWAYDRFGPEALQWKECVTPREYLHHGLVQSLGFHIVSGLTLLFFSAIGKSNGVAFWRYVLFFALVASELSLLFSPSPRSQSIYDRRSNILSFLLPSRVPFQHIKFLHQVFMFLSFALSRVAPVLFPGLNEKADARAVAEQAHILAEKVNLLEKEIMGLISTELGTLETHPLLRSPSPSPSPSSSNQNTTTAVEDQGSGVDERTVRLLTREMERMVLEGRLNNEPRMNKDGVDDGFVEARQKAVEAFGVIERQRQEAGFRQSVFVVDNDTRKRTPLREENGVRRTALPSPISPVRSMAVLQEDKLFAERGRDRARNEGNGNGNGVRSRAWSPLEGAADGGGSALGLGYVRARSKSC